MQYTAPNTPQQNGIIEREFPTIRNMAYASLQASDMSESEQMSHWAHAIDDCTIVRNLQPRKEWSNAYEPFDEQPPVKAKDLMPWGAKGWMTTRETIKAKWKPKAIRVTRVGYAKNHASGTYIILKHDNKQYVESRDITWDEPRRYRKLPIEATKGSSTTAITPELENNRFAALVSDSDNSDADDDDGDDLGLMQQQQQQEGQLEPGGRLHRELHRLAPHNNPPGEGNQPILGRTRGATQRAAVHNVAATDKAVEAALYKDPANDREAMEGDESKQWFDGLVKEYDGFFDIKTWKLTKRKDAKLGHGNKPLTTKNVYKKKLHAITKEPRYRVRNCIRGFEMIAGVHYDASFAPTPTNTTVKTVFAITLYILQQLGINMKDLERIEKEEWVVGNLFDIVQAFLNSELDSEKNPLYIFLPPYWKQYCELRKIEFDPTDLILLLKSQYGSTDSAKLWVDKFVKILTDKGGCEMIRSKVDPCVLYKKDKEGKLILLLVFHIDDGYVAGKPEEVRKLMAHLQASVEVLEIGRMDEHLGVSYSLQKDNVGWYYESKMDKYINKVVIEYEHDMKIQLKDYPTPATPGSNLMKLDDQQEKPDRMDQFRKYIGKILYAVVKVIPDCANAIRDLTCHMTAPGQEHWKALERLLGYLKFHYKPMKFRAPKELRVIAMFDSDWATDKNDRRSISSYLTTIGGTSLVSWQSKKQQTVALSSCESETMAATMCAQDVLFTMNLLKELVGDELLEPSFVYGDNVASLFLVQNNSVGQRTKHIDIRHRFILELVEGKRFELRHVRSEENTSDINSKNTKIEIHKKMADRLYEGLVVAQVDSTRKEDHGKSTKEDVEYSYATIVMDDSRPSQINYASEMPSGTGNIKQVAEPSETPGYRNKKEEQWKDRSSGDSSKESSERSSQ